jgi:hypothetical protein
VIAIGGVNLSAMRKTTLLLSALVLVAATVACKSKHSFKDMSVADLAALQSSGAVTVLDANGDDFRKDNGVIPNATLLSHFSKYDVEKELPASKDAKLVFYCSNSF